MDKYELSKDWIQKNAGKIKKAYFFTLASKYDIKSKEDILEILKAVDPINATEENAKIFSGILLLFDQQMKKKSKQDIRAKKKVIN